ncbi:hypothetical protein C6341_g3799 [Phytophthora cactorum]|nr:hypothetical protein PC120_g2467 [Phytophthora cactorum]KAG3186525.1 hypothetical protein C6341_g3799 [Phytophthora cactorum]
MNTRGHREFFDAHSVPDGERENVREDEARAWLQPSGSAPAGPPRLSVQAVHGAFDHFEFGQLASRNGTLGPSFAAHVRLDSTLMKATNGPACVASAQVKTHTCRDGVGRGVGQQSHLKASPPASSKRSL